MELWRETGISDTPARVGDARVRARSTELENAECSWSDENVCSGNWKSGGSGEFCSRLGRDGGLCVLLCERFRGAGFLLEVVADLASAGGLSSLFIAGRFVSCPGLWKTTSRSESLGSRRGSRRPTIFDTTVVDVGVPFLNVIVSDDGEVGAVEGLSTSPVCDDGELPWSSEGRKPLIAFAFAPREIVRGGNANLAVLRFGPSSKLLSIRKARLAVRSRGIGGGGGGETTGEGEGSCELGVVEMTSLLDELNPGMRKGSGALATSLSKRWRKEVGSLDGCGRTVARLQSSFAA